MKKYTILSLIIIFIIFIMCACVYESIGTEVNESASISIITTHSTSDTTNETESISTETEQSESTEAEQSETINQLESWIGIYKFNEFAEPDQNMWYSINIFKENNAYYAKVQIDGFQSMDRIKALVEGDKSLVCIVFIEYLPENLMEIYSEGDLLLKLEKEDDVIYTEWEAIGPLIIKNEERGIYFVKETVEQSETTN
jgi:hypothetical protein